MSSVPPAEALPEAPEPAPRSAERAADEPPWGGLTVLAAVALGLGASLLASFVVAVIAGAAGASIAHPPPAVNLIADLLFDLCFVGAAVYFTRPHSRPRLADFGFRRTGLRIGIVAFLVGCFFY